MALYVGIDERGKRRTMQYPLPDDMNAPATLQRRMIDFHLKAVLSDDENATALDALASVERRRAAGEALT